MFDSNLKPILVQNPQQQNHINPHSNYSPSIQLFGSVEKSTNFLPSVQGFVYNVGQAKPESQGSYSKQKNLTFIQNLGNSAIQISEKLRQSGFSWTKSETTEIPIVQIGVNSQSEHKTGEYAFLMMGNPETKNSMYNVTTFRLTNGDLLTKIETALTGSDLFAVQMVKVDSQGYKVNTPLASSEFYIPLDTSLDAVNFAIASIWVGAMSVVGKHQNYQSTITGNIGNSSSDESIRKERGEKPIKEDGIRHERDEILGDEVMCTPHDMGCSGGGLITPDGKFNFWFPCAGSFSADVYDCCYRHDVGLYCSTTFWDSSAEDLDLIHCISAKIIAAGIEEMSWICKWLFALPLITLIEGLSVIGYIFMPGIADYESEQVNYDGRHNKSCLCGGNIPTICCDSDKVRSICLDKNCNKVNLCVAKGKRISNPQCNPSNKNCFNCYWKCLYNDQGDYVGKEYVTDPTRKLPCCGSIQPKGGLRCPV